MATAVRAPARRQRLRRVLEEYSVSRDARHRDELVHAYYGLAANLAARFSGRGEELDDLTQVALMSLVRAIDRFDPERGVELTTFATATILGDLKRHFRDRSWSVRLPRRIHDLYLRVQQAVDELTQRFGRSPTMDEVARHVGASVEDVVEALEAGNMRHLPSLDAPMGFDDPDEVASRLGAIDPRLAGAEGRVLLPTLLQRLPRREQELVRLRFLEGLPQTEIARRLEISQMHVSRLLTRTLATLRRWAEEV